MGYILAYMKKSQLVLYAIILITIPLLISSCERKKVELKGIIIGSHYEGKLSTEATVNGINGTMYVFTGKDNMVDVIQFTTLEELSDSQIEEYIKNINSNYNIELKRVDSIDPEDPTGYYFLVEKDDYQFYLSSEGSNFSIEDKISKEKTFR